MVSNLYKDSQKNFLKMRISMTLVPYKVACLSAQVGPAPLTQCQSVYFTRKSDLGLKIYNISKNLVKFSLFCLHLFWPLLFWRIFLSVYISVYFQQFVSFSVTIALKIRWTHKLCTWNKNQNAKAKGYNRKTLFWAKFSLLHATPPSTVILGVTLPQIGRINAFKNRKSGISTKSKRKHVPKLRGWTIKAKFSESSDRKGELLRNFDVVALYQAIFDWYSKWVANWKVGTFTLLSR